MKNHFSITLFLAFLLTACATVPEATVNEEITAESLPGIAAASDVSQKDEEFLTDEEPPFWHYLAAALQLDRQVEKTAVQQQIDWFHGHPDYLQRVFQRAQPFLYYITRSIEQKKLPLELLTLPIVESAYDPYAYSYAGAAGIWQLMPTTATRLGVAQNWWYDGRRDIQDSTEAALDYLEFLNKEFAGDWLLSVAAYNSGEGTVLRAIKRNRARGLPTDFWSLHLPKQTRDYVPRWLALSQVLFDLIKAERFDILPAVAPSATLESVTLNQQIDLSRIADFSTLSLKQVYDLNPGFNHWATADQGQQRLLLPKENAGQFRVALQDSDKDSLVTWDHYTIKKGDALQSIAKRFHTSAAVIRKINSLSSDRIIAGKHLFIPKAASSTDSYTQALLAVHKDSSAKLSTTKQAHLHRVQAGESLWAISRQHGISVQQLANWNQLASNNPLSIGKELKILQSQENSTHLQAKIRPEIFRKITYPVRRGDSLARIAKRFNLHISEINSWNPKTNKKPIHPGQYLTLFIDVTKQSSRT